VRILDLFCGGGGAAEGYMRAGHVVQGVDLADHAASYPGRFEQTDWATGLNKYADWADVVHASPPCQGYSSHVVSDGAWDRTQGRDEPRLIESVRAAIVATGKPYVIENVIGARPDMLDPFVLCGAMFGLPIARHRLIESNITRLAPPVHPDCRGIARAYAAERGWEYRDMSVTGKGRRAGTSERWSEILGVVHHMTQHELRESIPPAYTKYIGGILSGHDAACAHVCPTADDPEAEWNDEPCQSRPDHAIIYHDCTMCYEGSEE